MLANLGFVSRLDVSSVAFSWKKQSGTRPCPRCNRPFSPETRTRACSLEPRLCKRLTEEPQPLTSCSAGSSARGGGGVSSLGRFAWTGPGGDDLGVEAAVVCGFDEGAAGAGEVFV